MTTIISQTSDQAFTLSTAGYTVEVFASECFLNVYAGKARLGSGRTFHQGTTAERLAAAIGSYKAAAVKSALEALADHLA